MSKSFLPRDFMERVVHWPGPDGLGFVNLHWQAPEARGQGFRGRPFKEINDFMDLAQRAAIKPSVFKEIYYCLSTQRTVGKVIHGNAIAHRHVSQVVALKSIWIDVDVKPEKGYHTLDDAMAAITALVVAANLPTPSAIVYSGGGVHVYWISDKPLALDDWRPYAEGLKAEIQKHGLKCDAGLTTDAARVLRIPGTFNNKIPGQPRPVVLKWLGDSYDFAGEPRIARLATIVQVRPRPTAPVTAAVTAPFDMSAFAGKAMNPKFAGLFDPADSLSAGINRHSDMPLIIDEVVKGCHHFQDCILTHGKNHSEPLWQLTLLANSFFEDGEKLAHIFSKGHPNYTREETQKKYEQKLTQKAQNNLGWPSCSSFESAGAKCKTCPFYNKLRSPLNLAARVAPTVVVPPPSALPSDDLHLPEGYVLNERGWISEIVVKNLTNGVQTTEYKPLFMCQLRNPTTQAGRRGLMFETSLDQDKWGPGFIAELDLTTEQQCIKQLRSCGVKPFPKHQNGIIQFMTSWTTKMDNEFARIETVPFGWLYAGKESNGQEIGFAYGGKVFGADGTEHRAGYADAQLERHYQPRGDVTIWYDALNMITEQNRPAMEAIVAFSFAAPLISLIGKNNAVACGWSTESGAHKSTAEYVGLAIWGCPRLTKESPLSSVKGIIHKLGQLRNLPVYWDEVSDEDKMDKVRGMLGITTEGRGATNLTQARNFFETDEWQTLLFVGANKSLIQNILRNVKDTDAQLERVFEFYVDTVAPTRRDSDVSLMINSLDHNYGKVGLEYAKYLGHNPAAVKAHVGRVLRKFENTVSHHPKERFRSAMAACIYAGAEIANKFLNCTFNLEQLWDFLVVQYLEQRGIIKEAEVVGGTSNNTLNAFSQFLKAYGNHALWVDTLPRSGRPTIGYKAGPTRERWFPIHIRLAVNDRIIQVSKAELEKWLKANNWAVSAVLSGLREHFRAKTEPRINLAAGAGGLGGQETVLTFPVPDNSPFLAELYRHETIEVREKLGLVTGAVARADMEGVQGDLRPVPIPDTGILEATEQAAADLRKVTGT